MTVLNVSILLYERKKYFALLSMKYSFWSFLREAYETKVTGREKEPTLSIQWLLQWRRRGFNSHPSRSHSWGDPYLPGSSIPRQRKRSIFFLALFHILCLYLNFSLDVRCSTFGIGVVPTSLRTHVHLPPLLVK